jgi:hypothetical protein
MEINKSYIHRFRQNNDDQFHWKPNNLKVFAGDKTTSSKQGSQHLLRSPMSEDGEHWF